MTTGAAGTGAGDGGAGAATRRGLPGVLAIGPGGGGGGGAGAGGTTIGAIGAATGIATAGGGDGTTGALATGPDGGTGAGEAGAGETGAGETGAGDAGVAVCTPIFTVKLWVFLSSSAIRMRAASASSVSCSRSFTSASRRASCFALLLNSACTAIAGAATRTAACPNAFGIGFVAATMVAAPAIAASFAPSTSICPST